MDVMHERVAGLDVHKTTIVACVRIMADGKATRECRTGLFDDVFRGFDVSAFRTDRFFDRTMRWPNIEVGRDGQVREGDGGAARPRREGRRCRTRQRRTCHPRREEDQDGRQRPVVQRALLGSLRTAHPGRGVDEDKVSAAFKNGVLTVTMPKLPQAQSKVKHIAINGK
jgi:HSP20 family protein